LPNAGALMRNLDAQLGVLDTFAGILANSKVEHKKASDKARCALNAENVALENFVVLHQ